MNAPGLATHLYLDLYGVDAAMLDNIQLLEATLLDAAVAANATVLGVLAHKFEPQGASVVVLVAESHLSIHTWPEHGYAAVDIFTCGAALPIKGVPPIVAALKPLHHAVTESPRGTDRARLRGLPPA